MFCGTRGAWPARAAYARTVLAYSRYTSSYMYSTPLDSVRFDIVTIAGPLCRSGAFILAAARGGFLLLLSLTSSHRIRRIRQIQL